MGRKLDPEIIALRAIERAIEPLDASARVRILEFMCARVLNLPGFDIESGRKNARLAEALRWIRGEIGHYKSNVETNRVLDLIDRALEEAEK